MHNSIYTTILAPIVTEKSLRGNEQSKYTFLVPAHVTTIDVARSVEKIYNVKVIKVNKVKLPAKKRLVGRGRFASKRKKQTKMIVTLKAGQTLDVTKVKDKS